MASAWLANTRAVVGPKELCIRLGPPPHGNGHYWMKRDGAVQPIGEAASCQITLAFLLPV